MAEKFTTLTSKTPLKTRSSSQKKPSPTTSLIVVVLILVSLGGFIWLAGKGSKEDSSEEQMEVVTEEGVEEVEEEVLGETVEEELSFVEDVGDSFDDSNFSKSDQQVGEEGVGDVKIVKLDQSSSENYYRLEFTVEAGDKIPLTSASIKANSNLLTLKISGVIEDRTGIKPGDGVDVENSVVSTVFHEVYSGEGVANYSIGIRTLTPFYLHTLSDPTRVVLDVLEQEVSGDEGQEFQFSSGVQDIEGNSSGNVILVNGLNYSDQGSVFRIIWKLGTIGDGTIPNATSEIVDFEGGKAIKLVVSNVYSDFPAENNYDQSYSHSIVKGLKGSFASHTSTYYIKLAAVREYKLYYRTAPTQLIVDVKR